MDNNKINCLIEKYKDNHILGKNGVLEYLRYEIACGDGLAKIDEIQEFVNKLSLVDIKYDNFIIRNVADVEILCQLIYDTIKADLDASHINGLEELQKREKELVDGINSKINKDILQKVFELSSFNYVNSKRVSVTYKGKEVGYHQNGTVHFYNTEDAQEVIEKFKGDNLFISSRRLGELKEDNTIVETKHISDEITLINEEVAKWNKQNEHNITLTGVNLTDTKIQEGLVWVPWQIVTSNKLSKWERFKMLVRNLFRKKSKYSTKKIINGRYSTIKIEKDGLR